MAQEYDQWTAALLCSDMLMHYGLASGAHKCHNTLELLITSKRANVSPAPHLTEAPDTVSNRHISKRIAHESHVPFVTIQHQPRL